MSTTGKQYVGYPDSKQPVHPFFGKGRQKPDKSAHVLAADSDIVGDTSDTRTDKTDCN